jgi:hypothetical protein
MILWATRWLITGADDRAMGTHVGSITAARVHRVESRRRMFFPGSYVAGVPHGECGIASDRSSNSPCLGARAGVMLVL